MPRKLKWLLTTMALAKLFRKTRATVNNWRNDGCPCVMIPGDARDTPRYVLADVVKWRKSKGHRIPSWIKALLSRRASGK